MDSNYFDSTNNNYPQDPDPNTGQVAPPTNPGTASGPAKPVPGPAPGNNPNQIQGWYSQFLGRNASDAEIQSHLGNPGGLGAVQNLIANSPEAQAYAKKTHPDTTNTNTNTGTTTNTYQPPSSPSGSYTPIPQDPRFGQLTDLLMQRAQGSLNIDPLTDPIIRPQVDNYGAAQQRNARSAIDQQAEAGSPYATGSLQSAKTQMMEHAGQATSNLQSSLMANELTNRRKEITDALSESGSLLTADQQLKLQSQLGLIDANLKQQGINSQNDQFFADLGLRSTDRNNYWNAVQSGLING